MNFKSICLSTTAFLLYMTAVAANPEEKSPILSLDELGGDWIDNSTLLNFPVITNFHGGLQSSHNITAVQMITLPPFAQARINTGWDLNLADKSVVKEEMPGWACELRMNSKRVDATQSRSLAYEIQRKGKMDDIVFTSYTRMPFEDEGTFIKVEFKNTSTTSKNLDLDMVCYGRIRNIDTRRWNKWETDRPGNEIFNLEKASAGNGFIISDKTSAAAVAYHFLERPNQLVSKDDRGVAKWKLSLAPGETQQLNIVFAIENQKERAVAKARKWAYNYENEFCTAKSDWVDRWTSAFIPGNRHFSGHLPTLETDNAAIKRIYYLSLLSSMITCRTNLTIAPRFFVTCGPRNANTVSYFWDQEVWANIWAMLEPEVARSCIMKWFTINTHACYAIDGYSGKGAGPWYAANDWAIFRCIEAYLDVTGDYALLQEKVGNLTILGHIEKLATFYETRPLFPGSRLANYGGAKNLLECSPTYIQGVPSLNSANVYMLRKTGEYYAISAGNTKKQKELEKKAKKLLPEVLDLYVEGEGVWNSRNTQGKVIPVRHCYDYITTGQALEFDLKDKTKREMNQFVVSELMTDCWLRAMSLKDPAAPQSDRADHGPKGSYSAWPALVADILCRFGEFEKAYAFFCSTVEATHQGGYAQSFDLVTLPNGKNSVRCSSRRGQDAIESNGSSFAEVVLRALFGYRPDLSVEASEAPVLLSPDSPRGFNGSLKNVTWRDHLYTITSNPSGLKIKKTK